MNQNIETSAPAVWRSLVTSLYEIEAVGGFFYESPPPMQSRVFLSKPEEDCLSIAAIKAKQTGRAYATCLVEQALEMDEECGNIFQALSWQNPQQIEPIWFSRAEVLSGALENASLRSHEEGVNFAMVSQVKTANGHLHLPMLDLRANHSILVSRGLAKMSRHLLPAGGVLLKSDRSFHLLGRSLITHIQWTEFLGRSLLFAPATDLAYVAHHLIRGFGTLRISPSRIGPSPYVVLEITDCI